MIIEKLEQLYRRQAEEQGDKPRVWNRASSIGRCPRELAFIKRGVKGEVTQPRRWAVFAHGTAHDIGIKQDLLSCLELVQADVKGEIEIEGVKITGECDALFMTVYGELAVFEFKTCADYTFAKAQQGNVDTVYRAQARVYADMFGVDTVVFVFYRKETSHMCEVVFSRKQQTVEIIDRFAGDVVRLATDDPLLVTEVKTPFDDALMDQIKATVRAVRDFTGENLTLPDGVNAFEDEVVKSQNKDDKLRLQVAYGEPIEAKGSWATFRTGRRILGFPCSYCDFKKHCFPSSKMEVVKGAPKWVI